MLKEQKIIKPNEKLVVRSKDEHVTAVRGSANFPFSVGRDILLWLKFNEIDVMRVMIPSKTIGGGLILCARALKQQSPKQMSFTKRSVLKKITLPSASTTDPSSVLVHIAGTPLT